MIEQIEASSERGSFLASILAGQASRWSWGPGIDFTFNQESVGSGVALNIKRQFQPPGLYARALAKRFQEALSYEGCYLCLDSGETFIVWHAVREECRDIATLQCIVNRLLDLAGLPH